MLCFSILPASADAANEGCLKVDLGAFAEVHPLGEFAGYAGWSRAIGFTKERLPMVPTMLAVKGDVACDLTRGLPLFVGEKAAPLDERDAGALALLAVGSIYVDVLPDPVALPALGFAASPPTFTPLEEGYAVDMTVWTPRNGVVADVRVVMDGAIEASFVVEDRAVGDFTPAIEGWNLLPGMTNAWISGDAGALFTKTMIGNNADGKKWRITYFTQFYTSEAVADYHAAMHMSGALSAYANATSWGFSSTDPDGTLDLTLDGCDCIYSGHNANIHMFPRANDILPLLPGLNYRAEEETAELIVGHELFHHFQYGLMQWRHGGWMIEGMARFSETANVPDFTFLPTTLTYWPNINGMNGFLLNPTGGISSHSYDWSIVWGYLYAHEGGMPLMKRVLQEAATGGTNANIDGPAVIQRAMDAVPGGEHATFSEAYTAFAQAIFTHEGFVWGAPDGTQVHNWATYFRATARDNAASGTFLATSWGIRGHNADPTNPAGSATIVVTPNANLGQFVYQQTGASRTSAPAAPVTLLAGVDDAVLVVVRANVPTAVELFNAGGLYYATIAR